jgi:excisionase family DNA binding protein
MNLYIPTKDDIREIVQGELSTFQPVVLPLPDELLTKIETAELLKLCTSAVDNLRRKGLLKAYRIGASVRFKRSEVLQAVEDLNQ